MDDQPSPKAGTKGVSSDFAGPRTRVYSQFNMAGWQINNINTLEQRSHELYLESDVSPWKLYQASESLYRAYIIFRKILPNGTQEDLDKKFKALIKDTRTNRQLKTLDDKYYALRDKLNDLTVKYFEAKQAAGINLPVDRIKDAEAALEELTQS